MLHGKGSMIQIKATICLLFTIQYIAIKCHAKLFQLEVLEREPVCEVEDRFLSIALGMSNAHRDFRNIDYTSQKLKTLITALRPAYLRLGGSASNFLFFKVGSTKPATPPVFPNKEDSVTPTQQPAMTSLPTTNISPSENPGNINPTTSPGGPTEKNPANGTPFTPVIPDKPTQTPTNGGMSGQGNNGQLSQPSNQSPNQNGNQPVNPNGNQPPNQSGNPPPNQGLGQDNAGQPPNSGPTSKPNKQPKNLGTGNNNPEKKPLYIAVHSRDPSNPSDALYEYLKEGEANHLSAKNHVWSSEEGSGESGQGSSGSGENVDSGDSVPIVTKRSPVERHYVMKRGKIEEPFWLMSDDFDKFYNFVQDAGLDLIFNLGNFVRYSNGSWNATNAIEMLQHIAYRGFKIGWQLGNEPNSYKKYGPERVVNATQAGKDVVELRRILRSNDKFGTLLVGPDVTRPKPAGSAEKFLREYLKTNASSEISAVSWHQYYVNGRTATEEEMVNPDTLDLFKQQIQKVKSVLKETKTNKPLWITETGSAWGGGAPGLSDTFAASFMYLDKLGIAGVYCNSVVARQTFLKGSYAMLDDDFTPRPDYWLALLHKRLVGKKVLLVSGDGKRLRAYAHCTRKSSSYPSGAVTVFVLNLGKRPARIKFKSAFKNKKVDQFLVTSGESSMATKTVMLNGEKLQMRSNTSLPNLEAINVKQPMKMPSYSYAFYVIPDAAVEFCK